MTTALIRRPSLDTVIEWTRPSSARCRPASKLVRRDTVRRIAASSGSRPAATMGEGAGARREDIAVNVATCTGRNQSKPPAAGTWLPRGYAPRGPLEQIAGGAERPGGVGARRLEVGFPSIADPP